ncbi:MAG: glycoside hydrolase family 3 C-terminal domain-containing protein [Myxococcota bacterium]
MSERVDGLLARLTLDEKVSLVAGADMWTTPGVPRLGIPPLKVTDGPNGARGLNVPGVGLRAACFPCGSALGATWNPELVERVGRALGEETRSKGAHVLLAPTVNIHRSPLAGRNFECYSEDPHLSAETARAYVRGVQSRGVSACIKHFVCNDSEFERHTIDSIVGERALREIYLRPFEAAVRDEKVGSVMGAYNRVNGPFACEHPRLLTDFLRDEWGFEGFVVSDWFATQSTAEAANAGLDLEMPGPPRRFGEHLAKAVEDGEVAEATLDTMVRRLLWVRERIGALDRDDEPETARDLPEHRAVAREAAAEAIVLLKNEGGVLPLDAGALSTLAVIGPNAASAVVQGGGSAQVTPHYTVTALDGIRERCGGDVDVRFERGCIRHRSTPVIEADLLAPGDDTAADRLAVELFDGDDFAGEPLHRTTAPRSLLSWYAAPAPGVSSEIFAARCLGTIVPPESGEYTFSLTSVGRSRILVDGETVVDNWQPERGGESFFGLGSPEVKGRVRLEAGRRVELCIEFAKETAKLPLAGFKAGCELPTPDDLLERAVAAAADADAAVVVVGLDHEWETEGRDREDWSLPGRQRELVERVAAANPRTAVVINAGSQVDLDWLPDVPAALQLWYPGQELGNALADVLFGDVDASGRLPTSFPERIEDGAAFLNYPGENGQVLYGEGIFVGYRWFDTKRVAPRLPFGHGLSYTTFDYGEIRTTAAEYGVGDPVELSLDVTNTGARPGREVVQLYLRDVESSLARPAKELVGFRKIALEPGEIRTVRFTLDRRALSFYDPSRADWVAEAGEFELLAGSSSRDIRARASFRLKDQARARRPSS